MDVLKGGNQAVVDALGDNLIDGRTYEHSYPYDWRTKQPVILRASQQWFVNTEKLKERALVSF